MGQRSSLTVFTLSQERPTDKSGPVLAASSPRRRRVVATTVATVVATAVATVVASAVVRLSRPTALASGPGRRQDRVAATGRA